LNLFFPRILKNKEVSMKKVIKKCKKIFDWQELPLLVILFGISLYFHIVSYSFRPGPRLFPITSSGLTIILIIAYSLRKIFKKESDNGNNSVLEENRLNKKKVIYTIFSLICFILFAYLFSFYISSIFLAVIYPWVMGYKKVNEIIMLVILSVFVVFTFQYFINIPLAKGALLDLSFIFY